MHARSLQLPRPLPPVGSLLERQVWLAAAANVVTPEQEHTGYVVADLVAKWLLLFVYITTVSNT